MNKKPELLAPAGAFEQLTACVRCGADAVYLGASSLNARRSAANFNDRQFEEAVAYCHERGVKVHLTLNTLLYDHEFSEAEELLKLAASIHVDAIIVQDMGLIGFIKKCCPDISLHASTQMSIHTPEGVKALEQLGFQRAVLSRELSLDEIAEIKKASSIELEVFIHGALCMSVSGQCYMSAMLGGRSGNRGMCAQPCRLPFSSGGFDYCLSLKDNCAADHIKALCGIGIDSFKIEGRMKRPEYCAASVLTYRQLIDEGKVDPEIFRSLKSIFSRSGFTDGYLAAKRTPDMFGHRTKEDAADAEKALSHMRSLYRNERMAVPVTLGLSVNDDTLTLCANDEEGRSASSSCPLSAGEIKPLTAAQSRDKLSKTGGTPYYIKDITSLPDELPLRGSVLSSLRKDVLEKLSEQRGSLPPYDIKHFDIVKKPHTAGKQAFRAVFGSVDSVPGHLPEMLERIYLPLFSDFEAILKKNPGRVSVEIPRGTFGNEDKVMQRLRQARALGVTECMAHNLAHIRLAKNAGLLPYGGFGLNILNTRSIEEYASLGLVGCEASFELTLSALNKLGGKMPRGAVVYGRLPLMLVRCCPAALGGCQRHDCAITDRMGISFPVVCSNGCSEILNSLPLDMLDRQSEYKTVDHLILRFTTETPDDAAHVLKCAEEGVSTGFKHTRGLYYRGVK